MANRPIPGNLRALVGWLTDCNEIESPTANQSLQAFLAAMQASIAAAAGGGGNPLRHVERLWTTGTQPGRPNIVAANINNGDENTRPALKAGNLPADWVLVQPAADTADPVWFVDVYLFEDNTAIAGNVSQRVLRAPSMAGLTEAEVNALIAAANIAAARITGRLTYDQLPDDIRGAVDEQTLGTATIVSGAGDIYNGFEGTVGTIQNNAFTGSRTTVQAVGYYTGANGRLFAWFVGGAPTEDDLIFEWSGGGNTITKTSDDCVVVNGQCQFDMTADERTKAVAMMAVGQTFTFTLKQAAVPALDTDAVNALITAAIAAGVKEYARTGNTLITAADLDAALRDGLLTDAQERILQQITYGFAPTDPDAAATLVGATHAIQVSNVAGSNSGFYDDFGGSISGGGSDDLYIAVTNDGISGLPAHGSLVLKLSNANGAPAATDIALTRQANQPYEGFTIYKAAAALTDNATYYLWGQPPGQEAFILNEATRYKPAQENAKHITEMSSRVSRNAADISSLEEITNLMAKDTSAAGGNWRLLDGIPASGALRGFTLGYKPGDPWDDTGGALSGVVQNLIRQGVASPIAGAKYLMRGRGTAVPPAARVPTAQPHAYLIAGRLSAWRTPNRAAQSLIQLANLPALLSVKGPARNAQDVGFFTGVKRADAANANRTVPDYYQLDNPHWIEPIQTEGDFPAEAFIVIPVAELNDVGDSLTLKVQVHRYANDDDEGSVVHQLTVRKATANSLTVQWAGGALSTTDTSGENDVLGNPVGQVFDFGNNRRQTIAARVQRDPRSNDFVQVKLTTTIVAGNPNQGTGDFSPGAGDTSTPLADHSTNYWLAAWRDEVVSVPAPGSAAEEYVDAAGQDRFGFNDPSSKTSVQVGHESIVVCLLTRSASAAPDDANPFMDARFMVDNRSSEVIETNYRASEYGLSAERAWNLGSADYDSQWQVFSFREVFNPTRLMQVVHDHLADVGAGIYKFLSTPAETTLTLAATLDAQGVSVKGHPLVPIGELAHALVGGRGATQHIALDASAAKKTIIDTGLANADTIESVLLRFDATPAGGSGRQTSDTIEIALTADDRANIKQAANGARRQLQADVEVVIGGTTYTLASVGLEKIAANGGKVAIVVINDKNAAGAVRPLPADGRVIFAAYEINAATLLDNAAPPHIRANRLPDNVSVAEGASQVIAGMGAATQREAVLERTVGGVVRSKVVRLREGNATNEEDVWGGGITRLQALVTTAGDTISLGRVDEGGDNAARIAYRIVEVRW